MFKAFLILMIVVICASSAGAEEDMRKMDWSKDIPTVTKLAELIGAAHKARDTGDNHEAVALYTEAGEMAFSLAYIAGRNASWRKWRRDAFIEWGKSQGMVVHASPTFEVYEADYQAAVEIVKQFEGEGHRCQYWTGICRKRQFDPHSALEDFKNAAGPGSPVFDEAWKEIEELTGISIPEPKAGLTKPEKVVE